MKVKIAVVQFKIEPLLIKENLKNVELYIQKASAKGAQIIIFPENFITGPIENERNFVDADGLHKTQITKLAKEYSIDVVAGSIIEQFDSGVYNTAYYIDADGKILGRHRKKHLWDTEQDHFTAGKDATVVDTAYGKIGILICWDMVFPGMWQTILVKGAQIVFCPSYWSFGDAGEGVKYNPDAEVEFINSLCVSKAFENEAAIVFCNAAKNNQPPQYTPIGRSQITAPFVGALARLDHNKEDMLIQELDTELMDVAEESYRLRRDSSM